MSMRLARTTRNPAHAAAGDLIGHRRNGQPIYLAAGGSAPAGEPAPGAPAGPPAPAPTAPPAVPPTQPAPAAAEPKKTDPPKGESVADLPEWAQKIIKDARSEAATHRTGKTQAEQEKATLLDGIAKALGLKKDEAPDPAKLAEQLGTKDSELRQARVELAVHKLAGPAGGDAGGLLDSRSFLAKVADLDPAAKDFDAKVTEAIKATVKDNDKLKAGGQAPPRSGGDFNGSTPQGKERPKSLFAAIAATQSPTS